jgi:Flp pilus assembly protein TadD
MLSDNLRLRFPSLPLRQQPQFGLPIRQPLRLHGIFTSLLLLAVSLTGCKRSASSSGSGPPPDQFLSLMNSGKNYLEQGDASNALATYLKAEAIVPHDADVHLNLANAYLMAASPEQAIREADEVLRLEPNSAAAYFVKGAAYLRLSNFEEAVKALENAKKIDPGETATLFQLGRARMGLSQWDAAITEFKAGLRLDPKHLHLPVHYLLGQALLRAGRQDEAQQEIQLHEANVVGGGPAVNDATFERTKFTQARVPFRLDQPSRDGIKVAFVDASKDVLGDVAQTFSGPIGLVNANQKGSIGLFALEKEKGFRVLANTNGVFRPLEATYRAIADAKYAKVLVGDLQNDRFDDVLVLGEKGSQLFSFAANGTATDASELSGLSSLRSRDGALIDLDFTGKLDLIAVTENTREVKVLRQFGPLLFKDITNKSGIPESLRNALTVTMEDWNGDGSMDVITNRFEGAPLLLEKERGGPLVARERSAWVASSVVAAGDFDNDLRPDLATWSEGKITICYNGGDKKEVAITGNGAVHQIEAFDYDNDGWLDLWVLGDKLRVWRNVGLLGFQEQTSQLGLDQLSGGRVSEIHFADFDKDCDLDVIVALAEGGLRYLRNDGGNANELVKVQMIGNRSNASGIGCKVEIATGGLRLTRTVHQLPVEVGVGRSQRLDSFLVHWFNWPQGSAELEFDCKQPVFALESTMQEGSCPYMYAWDGKGFRFITDILGAAPLGLPVAEGHYIESDPEELVWIGNEQSFPARDGGYQIQLTEELREVLYLDEAKLVVVDHEPSTEVHSTDKLLPGKPFPRGTIVTLHNEHPLVKAETLDGTDVTPLLKAVDGRRVSPPKLRIPQLRGLAEPYGVIVDFGALDVSRPFALVINGWLRFGGGMANIAASQDPSLPFPFPTLEAEVAPGTWKAVDVTVGAPAGKTKTIVVDLEGKLEPGTRRLRLNQAFEIHWDRIALMEKVANSQTKVAFIPPIGADLHFRGFSAIQDLPPDSPLTPNYESVRPNFYWTITPGGWCTRYGDVSELVASRDEGLALINGGDELTLSFPENSLPPKASGTIREFFLYIDGWDKDSDFLVATGTTVEPLPFHGMDDQRYGREKRPAFPSDALHRKYNTRWVEGRVLKQAASR